MTDTKLIVVSILVGPGVNVTEITADYENCTANLGSVPLLITGDYLLDFNCILGVGRHDLTFRTNNPTVGEFDAAWQGLAIDQLQPSPPPVGP